MNIQDDKVLKAFGEHFKKIRESKGISQEKLALKAGSYQSTVIRIEQGKANPKLRTLVLFSKALDVKLKELTNFEF